MSLLKEFREFAVKGNVIDLAVGVIIGAAFGRIVTSVVEDIVMPPLGVLLGRVDFKDRLYVLPGQNAENLAKYEAAGRTLASAKANGINAIAYGNFLNQVLQFLIVAFAVFLMVRAMNRAKSLIDTPKEAAPAEPSTKACPKCLSDIPMAATKCKFCTADLA